MQELYVSLRTRVYRFILRIVRDRTLAEDLLSEVFLDVWSQASRYQGRASASTWVLSIARNKALSALRRRARKEVEIEDAARNPGRGRRSGGRPGTAARTARSFQRCLRELSVEHAEVIDLVYYQNRSIKDVAAILDIPENTVKTRMHLARKHLAQMLEGAGYGRSAF